TCRTCGVVIRLDAEHYPFCSKRCRGADLMGWFDGRYKISREIKDADLETVD
ncbi:MAG: DNA gyrase inhibitor YacG, partial [Phycisphaerales bacterium]|nr:DNA gyrase inhibitor YacG [Phycisphaerales bacterium]